MSHETPSTNTGMSGQIFYQKKITRSASGVVSLREERLVADLE
jgi:hypothetical protein